MSSLLQPAALTVRAVRCRGTRRNRVLDAVESIDPATGLAPSAILVVRHVSAEIHGDAPRVRGLDVRAVARQAVRPAVGGVPADAIAVVFADEVEVLTCLVADIAAGRPLGWWWGTLLGGSPPVALDARRAAAIALRQMFAAVPAAAAAAPQAMAASATLLDERELAAIVSAAAVAHGVPGLASTVRRHARLTASPGPTTTDDARPAASSEDIVAVVRAGPPGRAFVELAAALWQRPRTLRGVDVEIAALLDDCRAGEPRPVAIAPPASEPTMLDAVVRRAEPDPPRPGPATGDAIAVGTAATAGSSAEAVPPAVVSRRVLPTRFGGIVYLAHLLERLGFLRAEATDDLERWGLVAMIAPYLGADPDDPVLGLLAELTGGLPDRPDATWAFRFPAPASVVLADDDEVVWYHEVGRLVLEDAAGLVIGDIPVDVAGPATVRAALRAVWPAARRWPRLRHVDERPGDDRPTSAQRWCAAVSDVCRAALRRLDIDSEVLAVPASVEHDALRVRFVLPLDGIDIGVRRAGLDRDPGWVPDLGRVVVVEYR